MTTRTRFLAWMLTVEGAMSMLCGVGLAGMASRGGAAATFRGGADTGALASVLGPVLDGICIAVAVVLVLLGAAGLVAGRAAFRQRVPGATRTVLLAYAVPWGLLAALACLRAGAPQYDPASSLAAAALAATIGLLNMIAARTPRARSLTA